jgi:thymidine kinase
MMEPGGIVVICGSMFAGKSEELIRRARRALYAKKIVQVFKPCIDNRYDESMVVTHMGARHEAEPVRDVDDLSQRIDPKADVILIEEVQFFSSKIVVAGLDQDFRRQPFGPMPILMAIADEVVKLRAICMKCGAPASHTYRVIDGEPAGYNDPIVLIGATESYEARCRACFKIKAAPKNMFLKSLVKKKQKRSG